MPCHLEFTSQSVSLCTEREGEREREVDFHGELQLSSECCILWEVPYASAFLSLASDSTCDQHLLKMNERERERDEAVRFVALDCSCGPVCCIGRTALGADMCEISVSSLDNPYSGQQ